jgi:type IV secretion system protein VirB10
MTDERPPQPATVPEQPEAKAPLRRGTPVIVALIVILGLIGLANISSLVRGDKRAAQASTLPMRPVSPSPQQVSSFETQQRLQAQQDAEERQRQQQLAAAMQQLQGGESAPGPESNNAAPMTAAQRDAIYGGSSNAAEAQAQAKQKALAREKQKQDALNSGTVAIEFARTNEPATQVRGLKEEAPAGEEASATAPATKVPSAAPSQPELKNAKSDPMAPYPFDRYEGRLYRIFEGTVLEGVVTNHIDGGISGPILVMLTTDYYSHDHQHLLMPQGTRLIGTVESVGNAQQRKMFVTFHRAVCPDGFSLELDKYIGLDPLGTTGLATKVNHGYFMAFSAAALIGGLGGLTQIGNNGSVLDPSSQIRNGISSQSAAEAEQVLNHFLNRLPVITLKEGSRARIYIGRDILVPSYAEHRMDPTL